MYAHRRHYVKRWEHEREDERYSVHIERGGKPVPGIQPNRISSVDEELMYWRKANQIHRWFVENVQFGTDDCRSYYVHPEKLSELLGLCEKVIEASKLVSGTISNGEVFEKGTWVALRQPGKVIEDPTVAKTLLPPAEGFFFGHYEYDEYYLEDVVVTAEWIKRTLAEDKEHGSLGDIFYSSSW